MSFYLSKEKFEFIMEKYLELQKINNWQAQNFLEGVMYGLVDK